ncbi:MAG TPA: TIGR00282 family metallophosphoesterase, partial [Solirubrobacteraceae bacterium]
PERGTRSPDLRILFVGDVVGRAGRAALIERLPSHKARLGLDAVVVNGENAAGGYGITATIANEFFAAGADLITMGNHVWDQRELVGHIEREPRIVRPLNLPPGTPGRGLAEVVTARGQRLVVAQVLGRLFMGLADDPFRALDQELGRHVLGGTAQAILVDVHAEATSEKVAMGWYLDGRVTAVVGTHTHVPTADARVLPGGTAYVSDVGMTGPRGGVIGVRKEQAIKSLVDQMGVRFETAEDDPWLMGVLIRCGERRRAEAIEPVRRPWR